MLHTRNMEILPSVHLLWEERSCLDGVIVCKDGTVPFSRLVLASHSPFMAPLLSSHTEEEIQKVVIDSVR